MTTYELRDLRRELEYAIEGMPADAPDWADLRHKLEDVLAEQKERLQIRQNRGVVR